MPLTLCHIMYRSLALRAIRILATFLAKIAPYEQCLAGKLSTVTTIVNSYL
jgi:hypothetical protein